MSRIITKGMPAVFMAAAVCLACAPPGTAAETAPTRSEEAVAAAETLTLADAVSLALERSPALAAFSFDVRVAEAQEIQARLRPNPEVSAEIEDIGLDGGHSGFSEAEFTVSLSQLVELGGKRVRRMQLAAREKDVAAWDYEIARADVLKEVAGTFAELLSAQAKVQLDDESVQLAGQVLETVSARAEAGRVSPLEVARARTARSLSEIQAVRSKKGLDTARTRLASLWGDRMARFGRAQGDLDAVMDIPPLEQLVNRAAGNPDLARWQAETERRRTAISVEKAAAVSDLTVSFGGRATGVEEPGGGPHDWDHSLLLGVSVPLPLFNRNQGAIRAAEHLLAKAGEERRAEDIRVNTELAAAHQDLTAALSAVAALRKDILPAATEIYESVNEAYRQGKFGYLDVLDAQRTLFEARQQHLDALAGYHGKIADIERLIGQSLWDAPDSALPTGD